MIIYCAAIIPLLWIAVNDAVKRTIPTAPLILLLILGIMRIIMAGLTSLIPAIEGLLLVGLPILFLSCYMERGNGIGGGDVKLCAVLGLLLGAVNTLIIIVIALLFLIIYALLIGGKKEQPFAPFVLLGYDMGLLLLILSGG